MIRGKYVLTYVNVFILFLMQTILLLSQTIYIHDPTHQTSSWTSNSVCHVKIYKP